MFRAAAATSPRQVKDKAHALALKGRFDAAAKLIHQHLQRDGSDASLWLQHAELSRRLRRVDAAVTSYREAAQHLFNAGHLARARAALVCAQQLAPGNALVAKDLARMSAEQRPPAPLQAAAFAPVADVDEALFAAPPPRSVAAARVRDEPRHAPPLRAVASPAVRDAQRFVAPPRAVVSPAVPDEQRFVAPPTRPVAAARVRDEPRHAPPTPIRAATFALVSDEQLFAPPPPLPYERAHHAERGRPQLVVIDDSDLVFDDELLGDDAVLDDAEAFFGGADSPTDPFFPSVQRAPGRVSASAPSPRHAKAPA